MSNSIPCSKFFDTLEALTKEVTTMANGRKIFLLTDTNVSNAWLDKFICSNEDLGEIEILELEPGESAKCIEVCAQLWDHLLECGADRHALLINFGGGVITDLGGFVAATYKRGIPFIHVPTSLLGMVDAANGGKTGINHHHTKNSIGSFQLPQAVLIYPGFLESLDDIELRSGFAEMLKHGLIKDANHWKQLTALESITAQNIGPLIARSVQIKEEVVAADFYEKGERKLLNVGHTIGHAIESFFIEKQAPIAHGEAVALGIMAEAQLAKDLKLLTEEHLKMIASAVSKFFRPADYALPAFEEISDYIVNDKKNAQGKLLFSLPTGIGRAQYNIEVNMEQVKKAYETSLLKP
ncbi:MAG TPA: 3-dehydroquinate synthase [Flavobacteriales bacterium]